MKLRLLAVNKPYRCLIKGRGTIEFFTTEDGNTYYLSCAVGMCRYSTNLHQAEIYLDQMLPTS
jgi:hypothetical protein